MTNFPPKIKAFPLSFSLMEEMEKRKNTGWVQIIEMKDSKGGKNHNRITIQKTMSMSEYEVTIEFKEQ